MLTRSKAAKMTTSSTDSMDFDINNQQGVPGVEREESPTYSQMTEETSDVRARGQESQQQQQPQEEITLRALMDFMIKQKEETSESLRIINENFREIRREQKENFIEIRREDVYKRQECATVFDRDKRFKEGR